MHTLKGTATTPNHSNKKMQSDDDLEKMSDMVSAVDGLASMDPFQRSSGNHGYERPVALDEFKKRRSWKPKEPGFLTPQSASKRLLNATKAPQSAPVGNRSTTDQINEKLMGLKRPPLISDSPANHPSRRQSWQPKSPMSPVPHAKESTKGRTRSTISTPSAAMERRLLSFSGPSDQIPPAFQAIQSMKRRTTGDSPKKRSSSPAYFKKSMNRNEIERVSTPKKEITTPQRLKKSVWPPVRKGSAASFREQIDGVTPGSVKSKRTSFEANSKNLSPPPLCSSGHGKGSGHDRNSWHDRDSIQGRESNHSPASSASSIRKSGSVFQPTRPRRQASILIRWAGPTYYTIDDRPLYDAEGTRPELPSIPLTDADSNEDEWPNDRPNVWIAPADISSTDIDGKWKVKRVWYLSTRDKSEKELQVDDVELMDKIKKLLGLPTSTTPNLKAGEAERYNPVAVKWQVKTVYDVKGEIQAMQKTLLLDEQGVMLEFGKVIDEQVKMIIEDSSATGKDLIAKWGYSFGDSNHSGEDGSWFLERKRLNASQSSTYDASTFDASTYDASSNKDDDDAFSFASEDVRSEYSSRGASRISIPTVIEPPVDTNPDVRLDAKWGYKVGGDMDEREFVSIKKTSALSSQSGGSSPSSSHDEAKKVGAKWGYGVLDDSNEEDNILSPATRSHVPKNPIKMEESLHSSPTQNQTTKAKWSFGVGSSNNDEDETKLIPIENEASLYVIEDASNNSGNKKASQPATVTQNEDSNVSVEDVLRETTEREVRTVKDDFTGGDVQLSPQQAYADIEAGLKSEAEKKRKKKKKKKRDDGPTSMYDLLCRDAWFDSKG